MSIFSRALGSLFLLFSLVCGSAEAATAVSYAGIANVGQATRPLVVQMTMMASGVAAAPAVLTQGLQGLDYNAAPGGTCAANTSYQVGDQCTVAVTFTPKYPGQRAGAVVMQATDGHLMARKLISGVGRGGLETLVPGRIDTVAGDGAWIYTGDGVAATTAPIFLPMGIVVDAGGNLFLSDSNNQRIRRVDAQTGVISTVVGTGTPGSAGDGGPATQAEISAPAGLLLDGAGNLYFVDSGNHAIRRVDQVSGVITTVAGVLGSQGYSGDGGLATAARLSLPEGIALDGGQNLYIADTGNNAVRVLNFASGLIQTLAGTGSAGFNGDNQTAATAQLNAPWSVAVAADNTIYIADSGNNRVRRVVQGGAGGGSGPSGPGSEVITTVAGNGTEGFAGDGASALAAELNAPVALTFDPAGDLYIADSGNNRVRKMIGQTGVILTIAGDGSEQFAGDGGAANLASLYGPYSLYLDQTGSLLVADMFHNRVRRISATAASLKYATIRVGKVSPPQIVSIENDGNADMTPTQPVLNNAALDPATTTCMSGVAFAPEGECSLGVEFAPTTIGPMVLGSVTAGADAGNSPAVISVSGEVLSVDPTALSLASNANPSLVGAPVTFTATVTGSGSGWTGAVTFTDGSTQICSSNLVAGGTATCTVSTLTLGSHTIGASYAGDTYDAASTAPPLTQVVKQAATLVLGVTPNPAVVTGNVTLTVTASAANSTPTGTVVFYDGATALGAVTLNGSGSATYATMQLAPGTHALSVQYAGDAADAAGQSNVVNEEIDQAATVTTLGSSNATATVGTAVTLTATVSSMNGPAPTGTVQFSSTMAGGGSTTLGSAPVGSNGVATLVLSTLTPGVQNIVASYGGDTDDAASASAPLVETIQQIGTTTALVADANPVKALATLHLTATVTMAAGSAADGAITGQVTFSDGATVLGRVAVDANGVAVLTLSNLAAGQHGIVAKYAGNTNYAGSTSPALTETVNLAPTTTALTGPASALAGTPVTLAATVAGANGSATGTVTFFDGGSRIGVGTLNAGGGATLTIASLVVGSHSITAVYGGDSNFAGSTSPALTVAVQLDPTVTSLAAGPSPAAVGQSVTLTATVTGASQNFSGSVNFVEGGATIGTGVVSAGGVATFTTTALALGSHTITAVYAGDANHEGSTSASANELIVQVVTMLVTASANPATSGTSVVFSAKVAGSTGGAVPTGTVTFLDGGTAIGTGTLDGTGVATFATSTLPVGTHMIGASYAGDSHYGSGTAGMTETIQSAGTQIALTASANPAIYGTPLSFTATIASTGGAATGTVAFTEGGAGIGTGTVDASGVARLTLSTLAPGSHLIIANYAGDGRASASVSTPLAIAVEELTSVALASNANPAQTLAAVALTATVTNSGVGVPTGTVTFTDGSVALGNAPVDASGHATLTVPQMSAGNHSIVAGYRGDGNDFPAVSVALNQGVVLRATATGLSATQTNANNPLQVTLISVVRWTGTVAPTGTVTFSTTSGVIGTSTVNSTGVASLTIVLSSMTESIVASYGGDASYAASASLATTITGGAATQFTLDVTPASMSLVSKQHGVVQVTATSIQGFADTLQFGCLGLPFAATCTFSTTAGKLAANGTMVTTLTVDTGDPLGAGAQAMNAHERSGRGSGLMMCFVPGALLAGITLYRTRRRSVFKTGWKAGLGLLLAIFAVAATLGTTGCAGLQMNGTPPGTYTLKVTASGRGTGATEFQAMTLTVTQ